jgi:hypothetical protein
MHPLSKAIYDVRGDGNLDVSQGERSGVFTPKGVRGEGNLYNVDIHLCNWLAGPQLPEGSAGNPKDFPAVTQADTPEVYR